MLPSLAGTTAQASVNNMVAVVAPNAFQHDANLNLPQNSYAGLHDGYPWPSFQRCASVALVLSSSFHLTEE